METRLAFLVICATMLCLDSYGEETTRGRISDSASIVNTLPGSDKEFEKRVAKNLAEMEAERNKKKAGLSRKTDGVKKRAPIATDSSEKSKRIKNSEEKDRESLRAFNKRREDAISKWKTERTKRAAAGNSGN